jgi:hypothetical protein
MAIIDPDNFINIPVDYKINPNIAENYAFYF